MLKILLLPPTISQKFFEKKPCSHWVLVSSCWKGIFKQSVFTGCVSDGTGWWWANIGEKKRVMKISDIQGKDIWWRKKINGILLSRRDKWSETLCRVPDLCQADEDQSDFSTAVYVNDDDIKGALCSFFGKTLSSEEKGLLCLNKLHKLVLFSWMHKHLKWP